jgi:sigma-B regulation protein RsbU (phosphoserine phosphatase)
MNSNHSPATQSLLKDFGDFFENSLCGFVTTDAGGSIILCNSTISRWLGVSKEEITGKRFSDLLTIGGRIYYETHLRPLLRMQGFFDEVALELDGNTGNRVQVLANALERRDEQGITQFIRFTIFKATDRRLYEQNLKDAKRMAELSLSNAMQVSALREQFIAVLGHDLRNPLGSIKAGASLLARSPLNDTDARIIQVIIKSASRMEELIQNVMDFARTRLGDGLVLEQQRVVLKPVIIHVIEELQTMWPDSIIQAEFDIDEPVHCDPSRIAQLLSNLVANAITHGSSATPVVIKAVHREGILELTVCNSGNPIPADHIEKIFEPFTRESSRPSQHGLGLGLYIASQISRAHNGQLSATSTDNETCFTFRMSTII